MDNKEYQRVLKITSKSQISLNELRSIVNSEIVTEVRQEPVSQKYPDITRYRILLENDDMYFLNVKKSRFF